MYPIDINLFLYYNRTSVIEQSILIKELIYMPPKAKFTKQQIAETGLDIIRNEGMENLTARAL